ncbi:MAG TPA: methionine--tRNA ligase [Candidatus Eisenbacteria bacterium]|nr:methionine--tRNA ligase [Candidatus Eisenbacteria bacterium]
MAKYYLTTPIYYVNDKPHIGHLYTTVVADVIARYRRLRGDRVYFVTGTDENSQKNVEAAQKQGYADIQAYLDMQSANWKQTWTDLGITFDDFIRTTEDRHKKGVEKFWNVVLAKGDIYEGEYEGLYCTGCEAFYKETDLVDGNCPIHKKPATKLKEKNWFFKLKNYRAALLEHIDAHPEFIRPASRRNEVRSYVDKFMEDVSISRETVKWGIPVPNDPKSVIYVWFDALLNYMTAVGYGTNEETFKDWWPADVHLVGKDIIKFHCALWPAMLMSAGLPLPKEVYAHGYFTIDGEKMSKSLGNVIDPKEVAAKYGIDPLRFYLLREIPFGEDGDFSLERLGQRYSGELGNALGNLLHRVLSMTEKYQGGKVPAASGPSGIAHAWTAYEAAMESFDFHGAIEQILGFARTLNGEIDTTKPWEVAKTDPVRLAGLLYSWLESLRHLAWMLKPLMPATSDKMLLQLGAAEAEMKRNWDDAKVWGGLAEGATIAKGEPLFPRLEEKKA